MENQVDKRNKRKRIQNEFKTGSKQVQNRQNNSTKSRTARGRRRPRPARRRPRPGPPWARSRVRDNLFLHFEFRFDSYHSLISLRSNWSSFQVFSSTLEAWQGQFRLRHEDFLDDHFSKMNSLLRRSLTRPSWKKSVIDSRSRSIRYSFRECQKRQLFMRWPLQ